MHIIYIHGFNSTGKNSAKYNTLVGKFGDTNVSTIDLPHSPNDAIAALESLINDVKKVDDNIVLVGTSLGGFYATYLSRKHILKCVLINPAIDPMVTTARNIGMNINYKTGVQYDFTRDHVAQFAKYYVLLDDAPMVPTLVFLDCDDAVLDYRATINHYVCTASLKVFNGGSHRFDHMADILNDIVALEHVIYG